MKTKIIEIVYHNNGLLSYSNKHPYKTFEDFKKGTEDLDQLRDYNYSSDDFRIKQKKCFDLRNIELCETLNIDFFMNNSIKINYFEYMIKIIKKKGLNLLNCNEYIRFLRLYSKDSFVCFISLKLYLSNPRSDFRKSLKKQLNQWLNEEDPKYDIPFSVKQIRSMNNQYIQQEYSYLMK